MFGDGGAASSETGAVVENACGALLALVESCQSDHGGLRMQSQTGRRAFGALIGGRNMSDPEGESLSPTLPPSSCPFPLQNLKPPVKN